MKHCPKCKTDKSTDDFGNNRSKPDGKQNHCKLCRGKHAAKWYAQNKALHAQRVRASDRKRSEKNIKLMLAFLADKTCMDCGLEDWRVFEFDHRGDKHKNIADMLHDYAWTSILRELAKCDVVCANCHKIRTGTRAGWYRFASA